MYICGRGILRMMYADGGHGASVINMRGLGTVYKFRCEHHRQRVVTTKNAKSVNNNSICNCPPTLAPPPCSCSGYRLTAGGGKHS